MIRKHDSRIAMRGSRLSAVHTVQYRQSSGLFDCLSQPRRIRPLPYKSKEFEMVETKPRRRIRVIHVLSTKKAKPNTAATSIKRDQPFKTLRDFTSYYRPGSTSESEPHVILADVNTFSGSAELKPASDDDCNAEDGAQECGPWEVGDDFDGADEDDDEDYKDSPDYEFLSGPSTKFMPVYGFESPFHPKLRNTHTGTDTATTLETYAERLIHTVLEDAYLEYLGVRECMLSHATVTVNTETSSTKSAGRLENGYAVHEENGSYLDKTCHSRGCSKCDVNADVDSGKEVFWNSSEQGFSNAGFQMSDVDVINQKPIVENPIANGHTMVAHSFPSSSTSSPRFVRSSYRISKRDRRVSSSQRTNATPVSSDDIDSSVDHFMKFTYHPTGDDTSSQHGSSFQSSTWGSSTASSLRYVRRFTSKRYTTKPLMLFIHGIGDSADVWRCQQIFFQERGYETVAMDLIGHGLSGCPRESKAYTFPSILTDVLVVFDRYSKERNVVIGHSYGCCFAAALARHRPKQVTHLILLSGGGPFPLCPQPPKIRLPPCLRACFQSLMSSRTRRKTFYVPSRKQTRLIQSLDIPSYVLKHMTKGQVWLEGDSSFHKQITIPTLLIYGLRDPFVTLVEECEMEKTIPRAFLELIPEASHMIMLEAPDQVNDMVYKFLRRWDR